MDNDMVEEEAGAVFFHIIECWHGFHPFSEVVNNDYDIFVPIARWGIASHEINTPFAKGTYHNDWMEGSGWCSGFMCV
jgi:hypothetical protein